MQEVPWEATTLSVVSFKRALGTQPSLPPASSTFQRTQTAPLTKGSSMPLSETFWWPDEEQDDRHKWNAEKVEKKGQSVFLFLFTPRAHFTFQTRPSTYPKVSDPCTWCPGGAGVINLVLLAFLDSHSAKHMRTQTHTP